MIRRLLVIVLIFSVSYSVGFAQTVPRDKIKASYYHSKFDGRKTTTGQVYRHHLLTAASNIYKLGTKLLVTNLKTGKSVMVIVNDRMASHMKNRVDLSQSAFKKIASLDAGVVNVAVEVAASEKAEIPEG